METLLTALLVTIDNSEILTKIKSENSANENLDYALIRSQQKESLISPVNAVVFDRDDILERNEDIKIFFKDISFTFIVSDIITAGTAFAAADLAKEAGSDQFIVFTGVLNDYDGELLDFLEHISTPFIVTESPVRGISNFLTSIFPPFYRTPKYQPVNFYTRLFWKEVVIEPFRVQEYYENHCSCKYDLNPGFKPVIKIIIITEEEPLFFEKKAITLLLQLIHIYSNDIMFSSFVQTTIRCPP